MNEQETKEILSAAHHTNPRNVTLIQLSRFRGMFIPCFSNGIIPTKEMFDLILEPWLKFYDNVSQEDIDRHNLEIYGELFKEEGATCMAPKTGYVYILQGDRYYKIGKTIDLNKRVSQISPKLPFEISVIHAIETDDIERLENLLHRKYEDKRVKGEWFDLTWKDIQWLAGWKIVNFEEWFSSIRKKANATEQTQG